MGDGLDHGEGVANPVIELMQHQLALRVRLDLFGDIGVDADQTEEGAVGSKTGPGRRLKRPELP